MSEMDRLVDVQVRRQHLVAYSPVLMLIMLALIGCIGQGGVANRSCFRFESGCWSMSLLLCCICPGFRISFAKLQG